MTLSNQTQLPS